MSTKLLAIPTPIVGDTIYIRDRWSIDHGWDDVCGGKATISKVSVGTSAGQAVWFIETQEIPGTSYNYNQLILVQDELAKQYGDQKAYPCPDYG